MKNAITIYDKIKRLEKTCGKISDICKILLSTDGSITSIFEVLKGDIEFKALKQEFLKADAKIARLLGVAKGAAVNSRRVLMSKDGVHLMRALSYTSADAAPDGFKEDLTAGNIAIGKILKKYNMETRREILSVSLKKTENLLRRKYRIIYGGKTLVYIEEEFFADNF
ncbi:MAG: chorismate pyruvate-lyase family protein [Endomicrobium sp.]|jgi:chorismate-pyruvate lyase|nr:chorismate pyruvate-lyase family protein [Endomicrobium sp.]